MRALLFVIACFATMSFTAWFTFNLEGEAHAERVDGRNATLWRSTNLSAYLYEYKDTNGCQYLVLVQGGSRGNAVITPRLNPDGAQICEEG